VSRENAAAKAVRYLGQGRIVIREVSPVHVSATARGDGAIHRLGFNRGRWWCSCPAHTPACSHLRALRLVTAPDLDRGEVA